METKNLFELIDFSPNFKMAQFGNSQNLLDDLKNQLDQINGIVDFYDEQNYDNFNLNRTYYETILICDIFDKITNKIEFFKKVMSWLETSASIVILCKNDFMTIEEIKMHLEEADFRSINSIDLFEDFGVISAKKIYMWAQ
jgi:hypothetical protein